MERPAEIEIARNALLKPRKLECYSYDMTFSNIIWMIDLTIRWLM